MPVAWFFAPKGAKTYYGENTFVSGIWDRDTPEQNYQLGEQKPFAFPYSSGLNVWHYLGQCRIGTDEQYAHGLSAAYLALPAQQWPSCCAARGAELGVGFGIPIPRVVSAAELGVGFGITKISGYGKFAELGVGFGLQVYYVPPTSAELGVGFGLQALVPTSAELGVGFGLQAIIPVAAELGVGFGLGLPRINPSDLGVGFGVQTYIVGPLPAELGVGFGLSSYQLPAAELGVGFGLGAQFHSPVSLGVGFGLDAPVPVPTSAELGVGFGVVAVQLFGHPAELGVGFGLDAPVPVPTPAELGVGFGLKTSKALRIGLGVGFGLEAIIPVAAELGVGFGMKSINIPTPNTALGVGFGPFAEPIANTPCASYPINRQLWCEVIGDPGCGAATGIYLLQFQDTNPLTSGPGWVGLTDLDPFVIGVLYCVGPSSSDWRFRVRDNFNSHDETQSGTVTVGRPLAINFPVSFGPGWSFCSGTFQVYSIFEPF